MTPRHRICALRGRGDGWHLRLEIGAEDASNALTSVAKDNLLLIEYIPRALPPPRLVGIYQYPHGHRQQNITGNIQHIGTLTQSAFQDNNLLVLEYD